jgi:High-affinity nickel-transport protein
MSGANSAIDRHDDTVGDPLPLRISWRLEADRRRAICRAAADRRLIRPVVLRGVPRPPRDQRADLRHRVGDHHYLPGVRHAFDADHIAATDNTTRKLVADGQRPVSVGLFFSLGHSTVVFVMRIRAGQLMQGDRLNAVGGLCRRKRSAR